MNKKITFGSKPSAASPRRAISADDWVHDREPKISGPTKRITVDVSLELHTRIKSQCAIERLSMGEVIREFLEQRFTSPPNGQIHVNTEM